MAAKKGRLLFRQPYKLVVILLFAAVFGYLGVTKIFFSQAAVNGQGDLNNNGVVEAYDLGILLANLNTTSSIADVNHDGKVTEADLTILISNYGRNVSGDTVAPTVSVTQPASGATVSGTITLAASATDNVGVTKTEFYLDTSTTPLASATWDSKTTGDGSHTMTAKAYDAANNISTSAQVTFTVKNASTPPPPPPQGGNLLSMLQYDMACANGANPGCPAGSATVSEAMPNGFTGDYAYHPKYGSTLSWRTGAPSCSNVACTMIMPWGTVYQQQGGNPTKAKVQISDLQVWALYDNNQWYQLQTNKGVPSPGQGNLFPERWCIPSGSSCVVVPGGGSQTATTSQVADGSTTIYLPQCKNITVNGSAMNFCGYLYHFWSSQRYDLARGPQPMSTVKTVITFFRARIDPATYDPSAKYVMSAGMDRWGPNGQNGWEQGIGRYKKVDANWRVFSGASGSVSGLTSVPGSVGGVSSGSEYR